MADIFHIVDIGANQRAVFDAVSTPKGLDNWWTRRCIGEAAQGQEYKFSFGPGYEWAGMITRLAAPHEFAFEATQASDDWLGSRVSFLLSEHDGKTRLRFRHRNDHWTGDEEHYGITSYCWAIYLRLLKRNLEHGEVVAYELRTS